jgi:uncharacterized protein (TIGR03118 family)
MMRCSLRSTILCGLLAIASAPSAARADFTVDQTNLASDISGLAITTDASLKNPWGVSHGPTPFWVSDQQTGVSTLYNGAGVKQGLTVTIPPPAGSAQNGRPTGQVFNSTASDFQLLGGNKALFIFASLNGTITAWNPNVNPTNAVTVMPPTPGAIYTGLTLANNGAENLLYAANAAAGGAHHGIDVFGPNFAPVDLGPNAFLDPNLPAGLTPYNVQALNGTIYVTYSQRNVAAGRVDAFTPNGVFIQTIGAGAPAGTFDAPWGLALAPASFGPLANALLVGNFGDPANGPNSGTINAFDPTTGTFLGQLMLSGGTPFKEPGLWSILPGGNAAGADPNALYFSAGINNEADGLFGLLRPTPVPEPGSIALTTIGGLVLLGAFRKRLRAA